MIISGPSFAVFRDGERIATVDDSTNYADPEGTAEAEYTVAPAWHDITGEQSAPVSVWGDGFYDLPLQKPADGVTPAGEAFTYSANDASVADVDPSDLPAAISENAMQGRCQRCREALDMFVEAYGSEAGNLALRSVATAGVYIGGGIAPKILPALETGVFMAAFCDKEPMVDLLRTLPVRVILNPGAGLLGAAVRAGML